MPPEPSGASAPSVWDPARSHAARYAGLNTGLPSGASRTATTSQPLEGLSVATFPRTQAPPAPSVVRRIGPAERGYELGTHPTPAGKATDGTYVSAPFASMMASHRTTPLPAARSARPVGNGSAVVPKSCAPE